MQQKHSAEVQNSMKRPCEVIPIISKESLSNFSITSPWLVPLTMHYSNRLLSNWIFWLYPAVSEIRKRCRCTLVGQGTKLSKQRTIRIGTVERHRHLRPGGPDSRELLLYLGLHTGSTFLNADHGSVWQNSRVHERGLQNHTLPSRFYVSRCPTATQMHLLHTLVHHFRHVLSELVQLQVKEILHIHAAARAQPLAHFEVTTFHATL